LIFAVARCRRARWIHAVFMMGRYASSGRWDSMVYCRRDEPEKTTVTPTIAPPTPSLPEDLASEALALAQRVQERLREQSGGFRLLPAEAHSLTPATVGGIETKDP
jgi:hypothetical protein